MVRDVVRDDGIKGLWRGTTPTVARYVYLWSIEGNMADE